MRLTGTTGGFLLLAIAMIISTVWGSYSLPSTLTRADSSSPGIEPPAVNVPVILDPARIGGPVSAEQLVVGDQVLANAPVNASVQVEVRAEVQAAPGNSSGNNLGNDSRANAFAVGPNAQVVVNVEGTGNAQALREETGHARVIANVGGPGKALAQAGNAGHPDLEAEAAGPGNIEAYAQTGGALSAPQSQGALSFPVQGASSLSTPTLVVNEQLVNVRSGPDTLYPVMGQVGFGESYDIVARDPLGTWWKICCLRNREVWITDRYIDPRGPLESVEILTEFAPPPPTATPAPTNTPVSQEPIATPTPAWLFDLAQVARHSEANTVVIYAWVHENQRALDGHYLRVMQNGNVMVGSARSSSIPLGTTRPSRPHSEEDKVYNLKLDYNSVSFPGIKPVGDWTVQLVDGGGIALGPPASFNIEEYDQFMELYVSYQKR